MRLFGCVCGQFHSDGASLNLYVKVVDTRERAIRNTGPISAFFLNRTLLRHAQRCRQRYQQTEFR